MIPRPLLLLIALLCLAGWRPACAEVLPDKVVVLTFDDASASHASFVAPLVKKHGFGATFFVCEFPPDFETARDKYMSWEQIAELHRLGFEIGNHTRTHRHVTGLKPPQLHAELEYIESRCAAYGIPRPTSFAYPAYAHTPAAMSVLRERGYTLARSGGGQAYRLGHHDPLLIPSVSTTGGDLSRLAKALEEARDGRVVVLTAHGVPDTAHPAVTTPPEAFARLLQYLAEEKFTVIALRDLARYQPRSTSTAAIQPRAQPGIFLIGDSTVNNSTAGLQGWGTVLGQAVDPQRAHFTNAAIGGRSSRSFLREGRWDTVRAQLQPGDFVLMQFGHNDGGPLDEGKARASLKGNTEERREVTLRESGEKETVLSYGGYLRRYIADTLACGATPIVLSPVPRNLWKDRRVGRNDADYGKWAAEAARQGGAVFIDFNALIAARYDAEGEERVGTDYFTAGDHTHTTPAGAAVNAAVLLEALRSLPGSPLPALLRRNSE